MYDRLFVVTRLMLEPKKGETLKLAQLLELASLKYSSER